MTENRATIKTRPKAIHCIDNYCITISLEINPATGDVLSAAYTLIDPSGKVLGSFSKLDEALLALEDEIGLIVERERKNKPKPDHSGPRFGM
jgi:hypothetical protein